MSQNRVLSAFGVLANALVGWAVAIEAQPALGLQAMPWQQVTLGVGISPVAVMHGHVLRRQFARTG
ncbi:DUF7220 family protein [Ruegeria marina]|uniref:Uncharacterized protein n=1 Tax=Ruegeria marina TaxID=639004 RepID=A0A1G6YEL5_9RHOB|nr:hypothetical protein [Ruegeria marina]SDD88790.1 hypothetical protein SAMN04488239_111124 [Ruegeria marina]